MKMTNFEKMAEHGRKLFLEYDREAIAGKYGTLYDEQYLYIIFLSERYRISRDSGDAEVQKDRQWLPAGPGEALIFYDIFCYGSPDARASGMYINHNSLVQKLSAAPNPGGGLNKASEERFTGHAAELKEACLRLNGILLEKGDAAFELPLFDFCRCRFQFWDADDEFPASIVIYMDSNLLEFMHFETTWYVSSRLLARISRLAGI